MSGSKHISLQRCLSILTAILSKKKIKRKVLAQEYGCTVRTIADDIAFLRSIGFAQGGSILDVALKGRRHISPG